MYSAAAGGVRRSLSPTATRAGTLTASSDSDRSKSTRLIGEDLGPDLDVGAGQGLADEGDPAGRGA